MNTMSSRTEVARLLDEMEANRELAARMSAAKSVEEGTDIARTLGFSFSDGDIQAMRGMESMPHGGELMDAELQGVTGGGLNLGGFAATLRSYMSQLTSKSGTIEGTTSTTSTSPVSKEGEEKFKKSDLGPNSVSFR